MMINVVAPFLKILYLSFPVPCTQPQHATRGDGDTGSRRNTEVEGVERAALRQLSLSLGLLPAHKCIRFR